MNTIEIYPEKNLLYFNYILLIITIGYIIFNYLNGKTTSFIFESIFLIFFIFQLRELHKKQPVIKIHPQGIYYQHWPWKELAWQDIHTISYRQAPLLIKWPWQELSRIDIRIANPETYHKLIAQYPFYLKRLKYSKHHVITILTHELEASGMDIFNMIKEKMQK